MGAFSSLKIDRFIEVDKLIRAKYQDNLEFMQWFKRYFELNVPMQYEYDPAERRKLAKGGKNAKSVLSSSGSSSARVASSTTKRSVVPERKSSSEVGASRKPIASRPKSSSTVDVELQKKFETLSTNHTQLQSVVEGLEKERDFYFSKLAQMEELLQKVKEEKKDSLTEETNGIVDNLFKIICNSSFIFALFLLNSVWYFLHKICILFCFVFVRFFLLRFLISFILSLFSILPPEHTELSFDYLCR